MDCNSFSVFGSTGTIGQKTLWVLKALMQQQPLVCEGLTAFNNADLLIEQALLFKAKRVVIINPQHYKQVQAALPRTKVLVGQEGLIELASQSVDWSMMAMSGLSAFLPLIYLKNNAKTLALANKESVVTGGRYLRSWFKDSTTTIIPVDSEHNAVYRLLFNPHHTPRLLQTECLEVKSVVLTASGGPFWSNRANLNFATITPQQAVKHPNWNMGIKNSIDSATMANKGLELIEAKYLFNLSAHQLDYQIHPQSLVHAMVVYRDGSVNMNLSKPDMLYPIHFALRGYHTPLVEFPELSATDYQSMTFDKKDELIFRMPYLAKYAMEKEQGYENLFNLVNEKSVEAFCAGKLTFANIPTEVEKAFEWFDKKQLYKLSFFNYNDESNNSIQSAFDSIIEFNQSFLKEYWNA